MKDFKIPKEQIQENLCKSIEILVKKYIADAGLDKVIKARVIQCIDEDRCKYICKYQDATISATSNLPKEFKYEKDSIVYILVPQGDLGNDKLILGEVK